MTNKLRHYIPSEIAAPRAAVDIALVGAGGTGSQIISGLARINYALLKLGHPGLILHAIDGDTISDANIGRQIFSSADVGRNKAETLISRINSFYGFRWYAYPRMMNQTDELCGRNQPLMVMTAIDKGSGRLRIIKTLKAALHINILLQFYYIGRRKLFSQELKSILNKALTYNSVE